MDWLWCYDIIRSKNWTRVLKYRFLKEQIDKLLHIDYGRIDKNFVIKNKDLLNKDLNEIFYKDEEWNKLFY